VHARTCAREQKVSIQAMRRVPRSPHADRGGRRRHAPDKLKKDELVTAIEKANARASRQARER
jgi:hypothetical protein